jgi:hypothetical protein
LTHRSELDISRTRVARREIHRLPVRAWPDLAALVLALGGRVLGGLVREVLLEEGTVGEEDLPADVWGPLYCTNAVRGVEPLAELDGRPLRLDPEKRSLLDEALARRARFAGAD